MDDMKFFQPKSPQPLKNGFGGDPLKTGSYYKLTPAMEKRAKKYGLTKAIETEKKKLFTGARSKIINELKKADILKKDKITKKYYSDIDKNKKDIIMKIVKNTGFPIDKLEQVINHLFYKKHKFADGRFEKFAPDPDIVKALERMRTNEHTDTDILLLKHEFAELTYMKNKKYEVYDVAHEMANKKYNWQEAIRK